MAKKLRSLKGQLLLDGGQLHGSFFHKTVVLVCQHDKEGALGLVLNRKTGSPASEALIADLPEKLVGEPLFLGGPVQPTSLSYLYSNGMVPDARIIPNVSLGHSLEKLMELGESFAPSQKIKLFAGYAGWNAGQLEEEMRRSAWVTHPASDDLVFNSQPGDLWRRILRRKGWKYRLLAQTPDDLSWN